MANAQTDGSGFYELELDTGSFDLCWLVLRPVCIRIEILAEEKARFDIVNGDLGDLYWSAVECMATANGSRLGGLDAIRWAHIGTMSWSTSLQVEAATATHGPFANRYASVRM